MFGNKDDAAPDTLKDTGASKPRFFWEGIFGRLRDIVRGLPGNTAAASLPPSKTETIERMRIGEYAQLHFESKRTVLLEKISDTEFSLVFPSLGNFKPILVFEKAPMRFQEKRDSNVRTSFPLITIDGIDSPYCTGIDKLAEMPQNTAASSMPPDTAVRDDVAKAILLANAAVGAYVCLRIAPKYFAVFEKISESNWQEIDLSGGSWHTVTMPLNIPFASLSHGSASIYFHAGSGSRYIELHGADRTLEVTTQERIASHIQIAKGLYEWARGAYDGIAREGNIFNPDVPDPSVRILRLSLESGETVYLAHLKESDALVFSYVWNRNPAARGGQYEVRNPFGCRTRGRVTVRKADGAFEINEGTNRRAYVWTDIKEVTVREID